MRTAFVPLSLAVFSILLTAALFGFFYAWVCSTMWGLDAAPPEVAIQAMQAMNASVRNGVFAPAFFGAAPALLLAALVARRHSRRAFRLMLGAGLLTLAAVVLTVSVNVPMNAALGAAQVPSDPQAARDLWYAYSGPWQFWNQLRTVLTGIAVLLGLLALIRLGRRTEAPD